VCVLFGANFCTITFNCSLSICTVWSILVNTCHSYGSLCYVVTIRAAPYLYCGVAVMFLTLGVVCWGGFTVWPYLRGRGGSTFMAGGVPARHQRSC
jgi:hypothetical protein